MKLIFPLEVTVLPILGSDAGFPVHRIYCVARNYADHALEMGGFPDREPPFFFSKPPDTVTGAETVPYPSVTGNLHHEVELVVALGSGGKNLDVADAGNHIFGYAVGVDLTRRDLQAVAKKQGRPWDVAKGFDESAPISSIIPAGQCEHPERGRIVLMVNGQQRQEGDLSQMIWSVPEVLAELSRYYELKAGDLIFTGTPAGVGAVEKGDQVDCVIEGIGNHSFALGD